MSRQNTQQPQPSPPPERTGGRGTWIVVLVLAAIVFYLTQKMGCGPVRTEEKMEWIHGR